jgi:multiple sugar transport system permease protein
MRRSKSYFVGQVVTYGLLVLAAIAFLLPLLWMLSTSLKPEGFVFQLPPQWVPHPIRWLNYLRAIQAFPFFLDAGNSFLITSLNVIGVVMSASLVAYAFARLRWPGRNFWFIVLLGTLMIPGQVTMIPVFLLFRDLGWINTFKPLTVPAFFGGGAFSVFLLRQFFLTIPNELSEAARIDGASEFWIYARVILPLSKPVLATIGMFTFVATWNDFLGPLIYLDNPNKFTLALGLRSMQLQFGTQWNLVMADSLLVLIPTVVVFFIFQRYIIQGIALTGIKG